MSTKRLSQKGFTLLEIMLVLVLLGMISVGVVMTLPDTANADKSSEWHAKRFSTLLQFAQDYALISSVELGIEFDEQAYTFAWYDLKAKKWSPFVDARFTGHVDLPDTIHSEYSLVDSAWGKMDTEDNDTFLKKEDLVDIEGDENEKPINPQVFIMSSGEVTPFSYLFYNLTGDENRFTVSVDMSGAIELVDERDNEAGF